MKKEFIILYLLCFSWCFPQNVFTFTNSYGKICSPNSGNEKIEVLDCKEISKNLTIVINLKENYFKLGGDSNGSKYIINEVYEKDKYGSTYFLATDVINEKKYLGTFNSDAKSLGFVDGGGYIFLFGSKKYVYDEYLYRISKNIIDSK